MSDVNFETIIELCDFMHFYAKIKYPDDEEFKEQGCPFCLRQGLEAARLELLNVPSGGENASE